MRIISIHLIVLIFGVYIHANSEASEFLSKSFSSRPCNLLIDTIKTFIVDDYPVTNQMFGWDTNQNGRAIKSGLIYSGDKVWFTNCKLKKTLVFELYTDYHRLAIFHFANNDIPTGLIQRMELHTSETQYQNEYGVADEEVKNKYFKGLLKYATGIDEKYFTTDKGFKLGHDKQKVLDTYGTPDSTARIGNVEMYEWDIIGDAFLNEKPDLKGKPVAEDSFGHQAIMFFNNNKLIGIVFHNDIP